MRKKLLVAVLTALLTFSTIPVMAAESPTAAGYYNITVGDQTSGSTSSATVDVEGGTIYTSTGAVEIGKEVTLTATPKEGYTFVKWTIEGDYSITSGTLESTTITILPKSDLKVYATFVSNAGEEITTEVIISEDPTDEPEDPEVPEEEEEETTKGGSKVDTSPTSPQTGVATGALLVTLLASGGVAIASKKKYSK